jgi:hypothetical protein
MRAATTSLISGERWWTEAKTFLYATNTRLATFVSLVRQGASRATVREILAIQPPWRLKWKI